MISKVTITENLKNTESLKYNSNLFFTGKNSYKMLANEISKIKEKRKKSNKISDLKLNQVPELLSKGI